LFCRALCGAGDRLVCSAYPPPKVDWTDGTDKGKTCEPAQPEHDYRREHDVESFIAAFHSFHCRPGFSSAMAGHGHNSVFSRCLVGYYWESVGSSRWSLAASSDHHRYLIGLSLQLLER